MAFDKEYRHILIPRRKTRQKSAISGFRNLVYDSLYEKILLLVNGSMNQDIYIENSAFRFILKILWKLYI